jgi:two-component system, LytTR family, response regulator
MKRMVKAIIIDDEPYCCEALATLLEDHPQIQLVAICQSAAEGMNAILRHKPGVVFLDVEMPRMNAFEMLNQLPSIEFDIIFTTSYDHYALKAIRFSALDYLLKPVDADELAKALEKVIRRSQKPIEEQLHLLLQRMQQPASSISKIALPTMEGLQMVPIDSIIYCESDSNYTTLFLKNKRKIVVSRTLKELEDLLEGYSMLRVHRCYVINLNEVEKYIKGDGGYLIMCDGSTVDVSKSRKDLLMQKLQPSKF